MTPLRAPSRQSLLTSFLLAALSLTALPLQAQSDAAAEQGRVTASGPVGLFFMTRYSSFSGSLEKAAWYFTADGQVYQNLETGLTPADLAAHKGPKGAFRFGGGQITVAWSDGKTTASAFELDEPGAHTFMWDLGIFNPAPPLSDPRFVVGSFEGGESLSHGGNAVSTSNSFEFRADGTFSREGVASVKAATEQSEIAAGSQGKSSGTWKAEAYSIVLTGTDGTVTRLIAFPYFEDDKAPLPSRIYLGGLLLKRK